MARSIMIQGTGSNVGKSLLVAGLARAFTQKGLRVAPFKPQNMSNNAAVTVDGGEIGRAQALQARAAGREPHTDMNPILLKPESETGAQLVVQGKRKGTAGARAFWKEKPRLMPTVLESFHRLCNEADLVLVEGAGSPAETNLRKDDLANMGFAVAANIPVVLVGDIDRGGVIAQLVGTQAVLDQTDRERIRAFLVNRFRGDVSLFDDGRDDIAARTGWPCLGVIPWFGDAWKLPAEDVLDLASRPGGALKVAVPQLPRIANFDDLDPLVAEPDVTVEIVPPGRPLPADAALVLLPGSKCTIDDLLAFRAQGWDIDLAAHIRRGGHVLGLCGGYQMLGRKIHDPDGVEGPPRSVDGLGHLDIETTMGTRKELTLQKGHAVGERLPVEGYEIHMGRTDGPDTARGWLDFNGRVCGATSGSGRIRGCYLHGIFASDAFREAELHKLGGQSVVAYEETVEDTLDALAAHLATHVDLDALLDLSQEVDQSNSCTVNAR
ncbi:cobyric acid synthase [Thalassococcus sp. S3]|uniref:cobyric acid synthase n=1 Tax=Thalassococcus sp. S3 TaxID=2017482 RepID=UPI001023F766|nr:cobyric acid synthase [Thalassococcus sp. S3]QBF32879.1 cobyric acid synthase CobQ [Thalassococcus sp. S3]